MDNNITTTLTLILLTWTIWRASTNARKWRMGVNSAFKGLKTKDCFNLGLDKGKWRALVNTLRTFWFHTARGI